MNELLEVFNKCYRAFYIGNDGEAWLYFSSVIEMLQTLLMQEDLNEEFKVFLLGAVNKLSEVERLKGHNNFTLIADILYSLEVELHMIKECC